METILEYEMKPCVASHHLEVCGKFGGNRSKDSGRSGAWFTSQKTTPLRPIFALSPKPIARFRWKRARLSLFRPQPHLPSFIQIHPGFRDLLAKTTFQIDTIIGDPIGIGSPITKHLQKNVVKMFVFPPLKCFLNVLH